MLYIHDICTKFREEMFYCSKVIDRKCFPYSKISKGNNSIKNVGRVMVLISVPKISLSLSELLTGHDFHTKIFKGE